MAFLPYSPHIPSPAGCQPLQPWPFTVKHCELPFHRLSWPSSSFPTLPATGCIIQVYVQTQVEPTLQIELQNAILCAPGNGSSLWFISNPAFSPALQHSEVLLLSFFWLMEESRATQAASAQAHTVMWSSGCWGKGQSKAVAGDYILSFHIIQPQLFVTYWAANLEVQWVIMLKVTS